MPIFFCYFLFFLNSSVFAATPTFSMNFSPSTIAPGTFSTLTYTIDNSAEASGVSGLTFSNTLPAGLVVANPNQALTSCINGNFSATVSGNTINFSDYRLGAGQSCSFSVNVTNTTAGSYVSTTGSLSSSAGSAGTATATLTVDGSRPGFSMAFSPSSIDIGNSSTLTYTIDNTSNSSQVFFLVFANTLPSGMLVSSTPNLSTTCETNALTAPPDSNSISFLLFSIAAGVSCTYSVDVTRISSATLVNITGALSQNGSNPSGSAIATLGYSTSGLSIAAVFTDDPVQAGGIVTLEYTINNANRNDATNISFSNTVDTNIAGLSTISASLNNNPPCGSGSSITGLGTNTINLIGGSLSSGQSCTFSISLQVPGGAAVGSYENTVSDFEGYVDSIQNTDTATAFLIVQPTPSLSKSFIPGSTALGSDVILRYVINNSSTVDMTAIAFTDAINQIYSGTVVKTLPNANSCGTGSIFSTALDNDLYTFNVSGGNLTAGSSCTFDLVLTMPATGGTFDWLSTSSKITAVAGGSAIIGQPASATLSILSAPALQMSFLNKYIAPDNAVNLEFTLTHGLAAPTNATGIGFTVDLDSALTGMIATTGTQTDICGSGSSLSGTDTLTLSGGTLIPGGSCTFSVSVQVPAATPSGKIDLQTSIISATIAGSPYTSGLVTDSFIISGLSFSKTFINNISYPGATEILRYTISNSTTALAATDIVFTDDLNAVIPALAATSLPSTPCGSSSALSGTTVIIFTSGSLNPGETCTFDIPILVPANAAINTYNSTSSLVYATVNGSNTANNSASALLEISTDFLRWTKTFTPAVASPGETIELEYSIANIASAAANTVSINFTNDLNALLPGLTLKSISSDTCGGTLTGIGTSSLNYAPGTLPAGNSCIIKVALTVPGNATAGVYTSTSKLPDYDNTASASFRVVTQEFTQSFSGSAIAGGTVTLTFVLKNTDTGAGLAALAFNLDLNSIIPGMTVHTLPPAGSCGTGSQVTLSSVVGLVNGSLPAGGFCSFDLILRIPTSATVGSYTSTSSDLTSSGLSIAPAASTTLVIEATPVTPSTPSTPSTPGSTAIDGALNLSIILNGTTSVLDAILNTREIVGKNSEFSIVQNSSTNILEVTLREHQFFFKPIEISLAHSGTLAGIYITSDGRLTMVTKAGIQIVFLPESQQLNSLKELFEKTGFDINKGPYGEFRLTFKTTSRASEVAWFSTRISSISSPVIDKQDNRVGLISLASEQLDNTILYAHQFYKQDTLYRQYLYPAPADWDSLKEVLQQSYDQVSINLDGEIKVLIDQYTYKAIVDYRVITGANTSQEVLTINAVGDQNNDGFNDYELIYPNGDKQILYILPHQNNINLSTTLNGNKTILEEILSTDEIVGNHNEFTILQNSTTNVLEIKLAEKQFFLKPVEFSQAPDGTLAGTSITSDGKIRMVTKTGLQIIFLPESQQLDSLIAFFENAGFNTKKGPYGELRFIAKTSETIWFSSKVASSSSPLIDKQDNRVGLISIASEYLKNTVLYAHQFYIQDVLYRQYLYPSPANWDSLKEVLNQAYDQVFINSVGEIKVIVDQLTYKAIVDYRVIKGGASTSEVLYFNAIDDQNNDGVNDFELVYPNGDKQILYILPSE
ncbi:MAG: hypothetical protein QM479_01075 [Pseudomonadota bacterium]